MTQRKKTLEKILAGTSDANIEFEDLRQLLLSMGFIERSKGGHHIFRKAGVAERPNIQRDGSMAKPYQVRQIRSLIIRYKLAERFDV